MEALALGLVGCLKTAEGDLVVPCCFAHFKTQILSFAWIKFVVDRLKVVPAPSSHWLYKCRSKAIGVFTAVW